MINSLLACLSILVLIAMFAVGAWVGTHHRFDCIPNTEPKEWRC